MYVHVCICMCVHNVCARVCVYVYDVCACIFMYMYGLMRRVECGDV